MATEKTAVETAVLNACEVVSQLNAETVIERIEESNFFQGVKYPLPVCSCEKCAKITVGIEPFVRHYAECVRGSPSSNISSIRGYETAYTIFRSLVFVELDTAVLSSWKYFVAQKTQIYFVTAPPSITSLFIEIAIELEMVRSKQDMFTRLRENNRKSECDNTVHPSRKRTYSSVDCGKGNKKKYTKRKKKDFQSSTAVDLVDVPNEELPIGSQERNNDEASSPDSESHCVEEYIVEAIVDSRRRKSLETGKIVEQYLVKWVGYDESSSTWEPIENLEGCLETLKKFKEEREQTKMSRRKSKKASHAANVSCDNAAETAVPAPSSAGKQDFLDELVRITLDQDIPAVVDTSSIASPAGDTEPASLPGTGEDCEPESAEMPSNTAVDADDMRDEGRCTPSALYQEQDVTDFIASSSYFDGMQVTDSGHLLVQEVYITPPPDEDHSQPNISSTSVRVLPYPDVVLPSYAFEVSVSYSNEDREEGSEQVTQSGANVERLEEDDTDEIRTEQHPGEPAWDNEYLRELKDVTESEKIAKRKRVRKRVRKGRTTDGHARKRKEEVESQSTRKESQCARRRKRQANQEGVEQEVRINEQTDKGGERRSRGRPKKVRGKKMKGKSTGVKGYEADVGLQESESAGKDGLTSGDNIFEEDVGVEVEEEFIGERVNLSIEGVVAEKRGLSNEALESPREVDISGEEPEVEDLGGQKKEGRVSMGEVVENGCSDADGKTKDRQIGSLNVGAQENGEDGCSSQDGIDMEREKNLVGKRLRTSVDPRIVAEEQGLPSEILDIPEEIDIEDESLGVGGVDGKLEQSNEVRGREPLVEQGVTVEDSRSSLGEGGNNQIQGEKRSKEGYLGNGNLCEDEIELDFDEESFSDLGSSPNEEQVPAKEPDTAVEELDSREAEMRGSASVEYPNEEMKKDEIPKEDHEDVRENDGLTSIECIDIELEEGQLPLEEIGEKDDGSPAEVIPIPNEEAIRPKTPGSDLAIEEDTQLSKEQSTTETGCSEPKEMSFLTERQQRTGLDEAAEREEDSEMIDLTEEEDIEIILCSPPAAGSGESEADKLRSVLDDEQAVELFDRPASAPSSVGRTSIRDSSFKTPACVRRKKTARRGVLFGKEVESPLAMAERSASSPGRLCKVLGSDKAATPARARKVSFAGNEYGRHFLQVPPKEANEAHECPEPVRVKLEPTKRPIDMKTFSISASFVERALGPGGKPKSEPVRLGNDCKPVPGSRGNFRGKLINPITPKSSPPGEFTRDCCKRTRMVTSGNLGPGPSVEDSQKPLGNQSTKNIASKVDAQKLVGQGASRLTRRANKITVAGACPNATPKGTTGLCSKASAAPNSLKPACEIKKECCWPLVVVERLPAAVSEIPSAKECSTAQEVEGTPNQSKLLNEDVGKTPGPGKKRTSQQYKHPRPWRH